MKKKEYQKILKQEKKDKKEYNESNAGINMKTFLIIAACVVGFVFLMFVFTKIKTGEWHLFTKENSKIYTAEVQDEKILCGSILNRSDSEYYVLAYEMKEDSSSLYNSIAERYNNSISKVKLYKLDFSNSRNNICKGDSINITNDVASLKLTMPTLVKIKDGKIIENYKSYDEIKNVLLSNVD